MSNDVLLTVSGTIPSTLASDVARGRRPRPDYTALAAQMKADVVDFTDATTAAGALGRLLDRPLGRDVLLAWYCFRVRKRYRVVVTDSERTGFIYAALCSLARRRSRHVMIAHRLSAGKKVAVHRLLRLRRRIDDVIVYSSSQRDVAVEELGYAPAHVHLTTFTVDTGFWRADAVASTDRPRTMICAVGQELRDYPTLIAAVEPLDVDVVIAAASPWSKRADTSGAVPIPANVVVEALDHFDLRQLYTDAALVVVPLQETDFQAGITTILEAMSMSRVVVCTLTEGQTDTLVDGVTGVYVPPGDVTALRAAIDRLLADGALTDRIVAAALAWVVEDADVDVYARRLATITGVTRSA